MGEDNLTQQAMPVGRGSSHTKTTNARRKMTSSPAARWHATSTSTWSSALTLKPNGTEPLQSSSAHQSPRYQRPQSGTTEALGAQQRVATATRPLSQTTLLWTITSPMSTREAAAVTTTQSRPEDGTSVGVQDVETPRHRFSRSPLAQTSKDAAGGDVESSRQLASATLASSITSSALAVPQKTVP